jgi:uncharacterized protein YdhG (YjbR/CyaY superfamily)
MQSKAKTIPEFIASLPAEERKVIEELDKMVRAAIPSASGCMKYGMPVYETAGRMLGLNAQKNYFAFYADPPIVKRHRAQLGSLDVGKSCIRFRRLDRDLLGVLKKIAAEYSK